MEAPMGTAQVKAEPQWVQAHVLASITREDAARWADGCAKLRPDQNATDDCVPTSCQLIRCLRAGELITEQVPREFGAGFAWRRPDDPVEYKTTKLSTGVFQQDFKAEPWADNAVVESYFFLDSSSAPELNLRKDVPEYSLLHSDMMVMVLHPSAAPTVVDATGTTVMLCATAETIASAMTEYAKTSSMAASRRGHDFGVVTVLADVPNDQVDVKGMHQHMIVYFWSANMGVLLSRRDAAGRAASPHNNRRAGGGAECPAAGELLWGLAQPRRPGHWVWFPPTLPKSFSEASCRCYGAFLSWFSRRGTLRRLRRGGFGDGYA